MSRARVTQWLSLLELLKLEIERVLAMGDNWEPRLVTERGLRFILKSVDKLSIRMYNTVQMGASDENSQFH